MRPRSSFYGLVLRPARGLGLMLMGLALTLTLVARPAQAHGGGTPQLAIVEAGPYRVSAWTQPNPIRVGVLHVTVAVFEAPAPGAREGETGPLVLDAQVHVRLEPQGHAADTLTAQATRKNALNKFFYETDLELPSQGQWHAIVAVQGPAGGGSADFEIQALPPSRFSSLGAMAWPVLGGLGLLIVVAAWWARSARSQDKRKPRTSERGQSDTPSDGQPSSAGNW
jgi:hypothetical protein